MVLLAGFLALLHRYTGQEDLLVGTPVDGRGQVELEGLVGPFPNTLVLRTAVAGGLPFRDLLARVRDTAVAAFDSQQLPFEVLVDELRPGRDLSRMPLVQVLFVGQNAPWRRLDLPDLALTPAEVDTGTAQFDLSVALSPAAAGWLATWTYSTDLFDRLSVERLAGHFAGLLRGAAAEPASAVADLPLLSAAERISSRWAGTTPGGTASRSACTRCSRRRWSAPPSGWRWWTASGA